MESSKFNKYQQVGEIANIVLKKAKELCQEKQKASYVCIFCDTLMKESLNNIYKKSKKGVSLPTCLSINNIVAHDSYTENNDYEIQDNDIIRIELACHIDEYVASVGDTIKIGDNDWENSNLMIAAKKALEVGIMGIEPNKPILEYAANIKNVAKCFGLNIVQRPNVFHDIDTTILFDWGFLNNGMFNEPSWVVKKDNELELEDLNDEDVDKSLDFTIGETYHLIVAFTTSNKPSIVSDKSPVLFQNTINRHCLKSKLARELISNVTKNYDTECFKLSDLGMSDGSVKLGSKECLTHGVIRSLGLVECRKAETVILKCSIVVQDNSVYKLTGPKLDEIHEHCKLTENLNNILKESPKFNKRARYLDDF